VDPKFSRFLSSKSSIFDFLASFKFLLGSPPMSSLNRAITCQAVPDVPKPADVEAQPEELLGDVIEGEMDLLYPWKLTPHVWDKFEDRNERTHIHPQAVLQRSEIAPCFWV